MKKSFSFISAFALTVLLILPSSKLCGQSTPPLSATDSLDVIAEYVRNSRAVLDSLTRLSDTRLQLSISKASFRTLQSQNTALLAEKIEAINAKNNVAIKLIQLNTKYDALHKKWRAANLERWLWRLGAGTAATLTIVSWVKPP